MTLSLFGTSFITHSSPSFIYLGKKMTSSSTTTTEAISTTRIHVLPGLHLNMLLCIKMLFVISLVLIKINFSIWRSHNILDHKCQNVANPTLSLHNEGYFVLQTLFCFTYYLVLNKLSSINNVAMKDVGVSIRSCGQNIIWKVLCTSSNASVLRISSKKLSKVQFCEKKMKEKKRSEN